MKFFEMLGDFFMTPIETIDSWFSGLNDSISTWASDLWYTFRVNTSTALINGVSMIVIGYGIYCAFRIMCTNSDEKFSEYINKCMIASLCYYFAKCGGAIFLSYLRGGM